MLIFNTIFINISTFRHKMEKLARYSFSFFSWVIK